MLSTPNLDIVPERVQGSYARLATLMGKLPELAIFRKFRELNILNLLSMQSELIALETEFKELRAEDAASECPLTRSYQCDWRELERSEGEGSCLQRDMQRTIRAKLEAYNTALLQQIELWKQTGPSWHDLKLLRLWLIKAKGNNSNLQGPGSGVWEYDVDPDSEYVRKADLVVLSAIHKGRDSFLGWMGDKGFGALHRLCGCLIRKNKVLINEEAGLVEYKDTGILTLVKVVSTLLASLLVTMPMVVLCFVHDVERRLGVVMGSTMLFSLALLLCSEAKRIEIFAATAVDGPQRKSIWAMWLEKASEDIADRAEFNQELEGSDGLVGAKLNGREIRNVFRSAMAMAQSRPLGKRKLTFKDVELVLKRTVEFQSYMRQNKELAERLKIR